MLSTATISTQFKEYMYCPKCDLGNQSGAFCKSCGKFLDPSDSAPSNVSKPESALAVAEDITLSNELAEEHQSRQAESASAELGTSAEVSDETEKPQEQSQPNQINESEVSPALTPAESSHKNISNPFAAIRLLWTYTGTTTRRNYIWFLVFSVVWGFVLNGIRDFEILNAALATMYLIFASSVLTRRLRETGFKIQWFLLFLIPLLGPLAFLTLVSFPAKSRTSNNSAFLQVVAIVGITLLGWLAFLVLVPGISRAFS